MYEEESKLRLEKILAKKITTAFIGALSHFEEKFKGKIDEADWQDVRSQILSNGNAQIRNMKKELEQYTITWNRYSMSLQVKNKN